MDCIKLIYVFILFSILFCAQSYAYGLNYNNKTVINYFSICYKKPYLDEKCSILSINQTKEFLYNGNYKDSNAYAIYQWRFLGNRLDEYVDYNLTGIFDYVCPIEIDLDNWTENTTEGNFDVLSNETNFLGIYGNNIGMALTKDNSSYFRLKKNNGKTSILVCNSDKSKYVNSVYLESLFGSYGELNSLISYQKYPPTWTVFESQCTKESQSAETNSVKILSNTYWIESSIQYIYILPNLTETLTNGKFQLLIKRDGEILYSPPLRSKCLENTTFVYNVTVAKDELQDTLNLSIVVITPNGHQKETSKEVYLISKNFQSFGLSVSILLSLIIIFYFIPFKSTIKWKDKISVISTSLGLSSIFITNNISPIKDLIGALFYNNFLYLAFFIITFFLILFFFSILIKNISANFPSGYSFIGLFFTCFLVFVIFNIFAALSVIFLIIMLVEFIGFRINNKT